MVERRRRPPKPPNDPLAWVDKEASSTTDVTTTDMSQEKTPETDISNTNFLNGKDEMTEEVKGQSVITASRLFDGVSTCIQLADENYNIIYMNPALMEMFAQAESDIRKELPSFNRNALMGMNMDSFHKNSAHQRRMMDTLTVKTNATITIGQRKFLLTAIPVFNENGKRTNTIVEWNDVTAFSEVSTVLQAIANGDLSNTLSMQNASEASRELYKSSIILQENIERMVNDTRLLSAAALEGRLSIRADATKHQGDFRNIVEGINNTLDAVITPLNMAADYIDSISKGNIPAKITDSYNGDFNVLKNNLNTCIDAVNFIIDDASLMSNAIVDGNLAITVDADRHQGDYRKIIDAFESALIGLNDTFYQINDAVRQVAESATQLSASAQTMAASSEEQSSAVEEITSALEETDSQVKANTENANSANQLVMVTANAASQGQTKMQAMSLAMNAINDSAQSIAKIIKVIDEIAFQTNLLALNAAVEAARAGQHGRGFAVVAQEVRNLAGRSAKAARETADLIESSTKRVNDGVGIATETGKALDEIVSNVTKVRDLVAEISTASLEQSRGVSQINIAMGQVASSAREGSLQAEEQALSSTELTTIASRTKQELDRFKLRVRHRSSGLLSLEGLTPDALRQLQAMLAQLNATPATPAKATPVATAPTKKSPKQVMPLDSDERGFGKF